MTVLSPPYYIAVLILADGTMISQCKTPNSSGTLIPGPLDVEVSMTFGADRHSTGGTTKITTGTGTGGAISLTPPIQPIPCSIYITVAADGTGIEACRDAANVLIPAPFAVDCDVAFDATRHSTGGAAGIGAGLGAAWPPNVIFTMPAGSTVAQLQASINAAASGQSVVCAGGTYALGAGNLNMKAGVNLYASAPTTFTGTGKINCTGLSGWSVTSADLGQDASGNSLNNGFTFNGPWIECNAASGLIANNKFINQADKYSLGLGSAINLMGCGTVEIINNDFTNVIGNGIGIYNIGTVVSDGNHFSGVGQGYSYHNNFDNPARGLNCKNLREWHKLCGRACIEVGPTEQFSQHFDNYEVAYCLFEEFNTTGVAGGMLAISLVGLASTGTSVHDNWIRRGNQPNVKGKGCAAIEVPGNVNCRNNIVSEFAWGGWHYAVGGEITLNSWYCPTGNPDFPKFGTGGWSENGGSGCNIHANTELGSQPARPVTPTRIASSTYYP